jgi:hypothetical protein
MIRSRTHKEPQQEGTYSAVDLLRRRQPVFLSIFTQILRLDYGKYRTTKQPPPPYRSVKVSKYTTPKVNVIPWYTVPARPEKPSSHPEQTKMASSKEEMLATRVCSSHYFHLFYTLQNSNQRGSKESCARTHKRSLHTQRLYTSLYTKDKQNVIHAH